MPKVIVSEEASKDFLALDNSIGFIFAKHIKKLEEHAPGKRLKWNSDFLVEEVGQGRMICKYHSDVLEILRIFPTHKEYEKWFKKTGWQ